MNPMADDIREWRTKLLADIKAFKAATGIPDTRIGADIMNDTSLVSRIRGGEPILSTTIEKLYAYMADKMATPKGGKDKRQPKEKAEKA